MALNCVVSEKIAFLYFWRQTDRQTDEQMDSTDALNRSRCRERQLNKPKLYTPSQLSVLHSWQVTSDDGRRNNSFWHFLQSLGSKNRRASLLGCE